MKSGTIANRYWRVVVIMTALAPLLASVVDSAVAQTNQRIAAVVNDDIISGYDLQARMDLVLATSNLPDKPEVRERLLPQILLRLADEKLQLQEAKRLGIHVAKAEVDGALERLEKQNGLQSGQLDQFLAQRGVDKNELIRQIEPQIAWAKVASRVLRPKIQLGEDEVADALARIEDETGKPQHHLAEIFLPVDRPETENETQQLAVRLYKQLQEGASFSALARSFSQGPSAASGGDMGWVSDSQLALELRPVVKALGPGQAAPPQRVLAGFYLMMLLDRRTNPGLGGSENVVVEVSQIFLDVAEGSDEATFKAAEARAVAMAAPAKTCPELEQAGKAGGAAMAGGLGRLELDKLSASIRGVVRTLAVNTPSAPVRAPNGVALLMVCSREGDSKEADKLAKVRDMLVEEKLEISARRYMRDLKRAAFIDTRM